MICLTLGVQAQPIDLRKVVGHLASPELGGRLTGSAGETQAAEYIAEHLRTIGVQPLPGRKSYLLPFEFSAGATDQGSALTLIQDANVLALVKDAESVRAIGLSRSGNASGGAVFAGYGIAADRESGERYDSFAGLDLKGKFALVLPGGPQTSDSQQQFNLASRAEELRTKAQNVRERGGVGLLVVLPEDALENGKLPFSTDSSPADSDLIAASISTGLAQEILAAGGKQAVTLDALRAALGAGQLVPGFDLPSVAIGLETRIERSRKQAQNVVGYLPATAGNPLTSEYVVVGAHYDHLGDGTSTGNSQAKADEQSQIHYGADDNASGTAAVLAAAEALVKEQRTRPIIIAFWSGEEIGTLGSIDFAKRGPIPASEIVAYINLDMVGRVRNNKLTVLGLGSSEALARIATESNEAIGFELARVQDPYNPSDTVSFYLQKVPVLYLFSGSHVDYHRPTDTADKINYDDLERVTHYTSAIALKTANLATRPDFIQVQATHPIGTGGNRGKARVSLGAIPDYSAEAAGLKLEGVVDGGPAAQVGLKEGDIIVEISGQRITNIYDYMAALGKLKAGTAVPVAYEREGKRADVEITPIERGASH